MNAPILVLNCGSSSIKFALFDVDSEEVSRRARWGGKIDRPPSREIAFLSSGPPTWRPPFM